MTSTQISMRRQLALSTRKHPVLSLKPNQITVKSFIFVNIALQDKRALTRKLEKFCEIEDFTAVEHGGSLMAVEVVG